MKCSSCLIGFAVIIVLSTTVECRKNKKNTGKFNPFNTEPTKETGTQDKPNPFGSSITDFTLDFLRALHESESSFGTLKKNLVFSSSSIFKVLLLLTFGANGDTKSQLNNALHLQKFGNVNEGYKTWKGQHVPGILEADRLYYDTSVEMKQQVKSLLTDDIHQVKMDDASTLNEVNRWVWNMTQGNIRRLLTEELDDTKLLMLSAVYMRGKWNEKFEIPLTEKKDFKTVDGKNKKADMMFMRSYLQYSESEPLKSQVLSLLYEDSPLSFLVFLPNVTTGQTVDKLIASLSQEEIKYTVDQMILRNVRLHLPRFQVEAEIDLIPILKTLGINNVVTDEADLSGFTGGRLKLKKALHKVDLQVDETGRTAPAATYVPLSISATVTFNADHPFVYMVYDRVSHMPLFVGVVMDPTQE